MKTWFIAFKLNVSLTSVGNNSYGFGFVCDLFDIISSCR